jgi:hypothetical protein
MKINTNPKKSDRRGNLKYLLTVGQRVVGYISTLLKIIIPLFVALWVFTVFGGRGLLYLALAFSILIAVRIAFNFKQYMSIVRYGEMKIFGKPLDRQYWKDEKPKMPKVVWRKKKNE